MQPGTHLFSIFLGFTAAGILITLALVWWIASTVKKWRRRAHDGGYSSLSAFLRATPHTDSERKEAVDLALKGLVLLLIGSLFPPLLLIAVFPLYFGVRKVAYWSVGVGLFDEREQPGT